MFLLKSTLALTRNWNSLRNFFLPFSNTVCNPYAPLNHLSPPSQVRSFTYLVLYCSSFLYTLVGFIVGASNIGSFNGWNQIETWHVHVTLEVVIHLLDLGDDFQQLKSHKFTLYVFTLSMLDFGNLLQLS